MSSEITLWRPETIQPLADLSGRLALSQLIPTALRNKPADVLVVLMKGMELGLSPIQSLSEIHVIEGKPCSSAALKMGLCVQRRDVCEYFTCVESTEQQAVYETKRAGSEPVKLAWTMVQAQKAGLVAKQNWQRHGAAMLRARCQSALATAVYPDLVQGLMTNEEAEEAIDSPVYGIDGIRDNDSTQAKPAGRLSTIKEDMRRQLIRDESTPPPPPLSAQAALPAETTPAVTSSGEPPPEVKLPTVTAPKATAARARRMPLIQVEGPPEPPPLSDADYMP